MYRTNDLNGVFFFLFSFFYCPMWCCSGLFRTMYGNSQSKIDLIPVDYVINASIVLGWYVGTRKLDLPEVIHSTSGDVNPLSLQDFTDIINEKVSVNPSLMMVWKPSAKIRNGLRHNIFFYLFHIFPTMLWFWPEKILGLGLRHHTYVVCDFRLISIQRFNIQSNSQ